jgi:hypothetical protein
MTIVKKAEQHNSRAYWCGWFDGRYGDNEPFTENHRLAEWDDAAYSRLDYYRGHRAGSEARRRGSSDFLEAS